MWGSSKIAKLFHPRKLEDSLAGYQSYIAEGACNEEVYSGLVRLYVLFNSHVSELARVKNIAAFLALNKFYVFLARYYTHARMPTDFLHIRCFGMSFRDW
jgi:hypothetical protein